MGRDDFRRFIFDRTGSYQCGFGGFNGTFVQMDEGGYNSAYRTFYMGKPIYLYFSRVSRNFLPILAPPPTVTMFDDVCGLKTWFGRLTLIEDEL